MKRTILITLVLMSSLALHAQFVISDPASVTQRATIWFQEFAEMLKTFNETAQQTYNTGEMLEQSKRALEKLQKVSDFVQSSSLSIDIVNEGMQMAQQIQQINEHFGQLKSLTEQEIANALCFSIEIGEQVSEKVEEAKTMLGKKGNNGEMSDYERIQLLQKIKKDIKDIRAMLTKVQKRFKDKSSTALLDSYLRTMTNDVIFYGLAEQYAVDYDPGSVVKRVEKAKKKSTTQSTSTTKK